MRIRSIGACAALSLVAAACGGGDGDATPKSGGTPASPVGSATVLGTDQLTFSPAVVTLSVGGTVTWKNEGSVPHTVTFGAIDKPLKPGQTVTFTFTSAGTTSVRCTIHPTMRGTVLVK